MSANTTSERAKRNDNAQNIANSVASVQYPTYQVIAMTISFAFGILDMQFLYRAIMNITEKSNVPLNSGMSMLVALIFAEIANILAFELGKKNGEKMNKKFLNKDTIGYFIGWFVIGLIYLGIRIRNLMLDPNFNLANEVVSLSFLAISFIGTGFALWGGARVVFDRNTRLYRKVSKEFAKEYAQMTGVYAEIQRNFGDLVDYDVNYKNLEIQKDKIEKSIKRAEKATMNDIVGKVIQHNSIDPDDAHRVMDEVLASRKKDNDENSEF